MTYGYIFAAGKGTRLQPLTETTPKPLIEVKDGKSFIDYSIETLLRSEISEIFINYSYGRELFEQKVDEYAGQATIHLIEEDKPRGQGNAILSVVTKLDSEDSLITLNGDTIIDINLTEVFYSNVVLPQIITSRSIDYLPKGLISDGDSNLIGYVGPTKEFYYSDQDDKASLRNALGVYLFPAKQLQEINTNQPFVGFYGEEDIYDLLQQQGIFAKLVEFEPQRYFSVNSVEELNKLKEQI